jgi:uncharacterized protein DUF6152
MNRLLGLALAGVVVAGGPLSAHHSYAAYDREHPISLEGDIEQIAYENPHTVLTLRASKTVYVLEWGALNQLKRWNVEPGTLKVGDHVIVTGSPWRDPSVPRMSLLREIRRPADGWWWVR